MTENTPTEDSDSSVPPPAVPDGRLADGWELSDRSVETLFELRQASVRGHTLVYEDRPLRATVREATDGRLDQPFRFFFATRLTFSPPLPPGVGTAMVLPMVTSQARSAFVEDLRDRGFESIDRGRTEQVRTESGERASLQKISASFSLPVVDRELPIEGWVGVWAAGDVRVAGGAYPATSLADLFDGDDDLLARSPATYRNELLELIRAVG